MRRRKRALKIISFVSAGCLSLAVGLGVLDAATKVPEASQLIAILGDAFKLSLGAILMLLTGHAFALRR